MKVLGAWKVSTTYKETTTRSSVKFFFPFFVIYFLDTLILQIYFFIILNINFWGNLSDVSARKASLQIMQPKELAIVYPSDCARPMSISASGFQNEIK